MDQDEYKNILHQMEVTFPSIQPIIKLRLDCHAGVITKEEYYKQYPIVHKQCSMIVVSHKEWSRCQDVLELTFVLCKI